MLGQLARDTIENNNLYDAFRTLTSLQRGLVRMCVVFELEENEIAKHLGYETDTIRREVREALSQLGEHASLKPIV